jgi:diguanylate cyclase (GGDEF)-like protein/PAS domain S-box-containing protein
LTGLAKLLAHPRIEAITLAHLIRHEVDCRHREWFARCRIEQTLGFPRQSFDLGRTALLGAASFSFLPTALWLVIVLGGLAFAAAHLAFVRSAGRRNEQETVRLRQLSALMTARSLYWTASLTTCLLLAPAGMELPLAMLGAIVMLIDGLNCIAVPRLGLFAAAIQALAIGGALFIAGGIANVLAGSIVILALAFMHFGLFNLNYMFATRRLRTRELRERNETVQLLLNYYDKESSDWLFECDCDGNIVQPSERFCEAVKLSRFELAGKRFSQFMLDSPGLAVFRDRVAAVEPFRDLVVPVSVGDEIRWWSLSGRPTYAADGERTGWRGFVADVSKTRQAEEKAAFMENYDVLTGLPNRTLFSDSLAHALERREAADLIAVLHIDIDQFKSINETHGHSFGDRVLAEAAKRIEAAVPPHAMIGRLGGDEFAVIIENARDPELSLRTAKVVAAALNKPVEIDGQKLPLGACVGVAHGPCDGESGGDVLRAADLALRDAKAKGSHRASLFTAQMQAQALERRQLEFDLRDALARHELQVHYQPLLNASSGKIVGYEALLRWNHPVRGMIPPTTFIPIAEESGQIIPIGAWVLREALKEASHWPEEIFISINLSPIQMRDPRLLSTIFMALSASGVAPQRVELEITESVLMTDSEENLAILHKIRDLGVKIALDDFGTGYSSLSYLRSFPFDKIKIDRCFITDLAQKSDSQAIVTAVIKLAEELGMCTLAEGVENMDQLERLRSTGCEQVQGFLFSRARPADELEHHDGQSEAQGSRASVTPFRKGDVGNTPVQAKIPNRAAV